MAALITSLCIGFALNVELKHCAERLLPIFSATIAKAVGGIFAVVRLKLDVYWHQVDKQRGRFLQWLQKSLKESSTTTNKDESTSGKIDISEVISENTTDGEKVWPNESKMIELTKKRNRPKKEGRAERRERKERERAKRENQNIRKEITLLEEIKDILDELNIIRIVLEEQKAVWEKIFGLIAGVGKRRAATT
jgi:hypothetical protein